MPPDPPELAEDVELDLEQRRYVLETYAKLDRLSHYEILGVPRTADKKTIKRAYFKLAAQNHPDRYFTKRLGSYKSKLEAIFARTTTAFETLSAPDRKAVYDAALAKTAGPGGSGAAKPAADPEAVAKRKAALDALTQRFAEYQARAKRYVDAATRARAAGDVVAAAEAYEIALALTPRDTSIQAALAECQKLASTRLAESAERQALLQERFGQWAEAASSWQEVLDVRPDDPRARERLAAALARAGETGAR